MQSIKTILSHTEIVDPPLTFNIVIVVLDKEFVKSGFRGLVSNGNGAIFVVLDLWISFLARRHDDIGCIKKTGNMSTVIPK